LLVSQTGFHNCLGLGFVLNQPPGFFGPNASAFGHAGWGGVIGFADPDVSISFGYTMNQLHADIDSDQRASSLVEAVYTSL
jgi:CubicO group peptidase (beta-lactamase class C family)